MTVLGFLVHTLVQNHILKHVMKMVFIGLRLTTIWLLFLDLCFLCIIRCCLNGCLPFLPPKHLRGEELLNLRANLLLFYLLVLFELVCQIGYHFDSIAVFGASIRGRNLAAQAH